MSLSERSKISVVIHVDGEIKVVLEHGRKVEVVPVEVAKPDGLVVFDDTGHRNGDGLEVGSAEIDADLLEDNTVKFLLILDSGEFN